MYRIFVGCSRAAIAAILLLAFTVQVSAYAGNKWRIQCSESAKSDGQIIFLVEPKGGEPVRVVVDISRGTSENHVASKIRDAFKAQLPSDVFHVEKDDGEDVLVKRHHGTANFTLKVLENTVKSVRINLDHE